VSSHLSDEVVGGLVGCHLQLSWKNFNSRIY
jgi:hypothetical protein